jgi:hypothetical protein
MFRKTLIALTAVAALTAAALTPTSASAGWRGHWHGGWHGGWHRGYGWVAPAVVAGAIVTGAAIAASNRCYVRRWVHTPAGPRRVWVNVC